MGTRHLNLLFFLPEGENPFPSQPFLKRNFDLLNPEARVFFPLRQVVWHGDRQAVQRQLLCFLALTPQLHQLPLGCRLAPRVPSGVTLVPLKSLSLDIEQCTLA